MAFTMSVWRQRTVSRCPRPEPQSPEAAPSDSTSVLPLPAPPWASCTAHSPWHSASGQPCSPLAHLYLRLQGLGRKSWQEFSEKPREGYQAGWQEGTGWEAGASPYRAIHDDHCSRAQTRLCLHQPVEVHQHRLTHGLGDQWGGRAAGDHSKEVVPATRDTPWVPISPQNDGWSGLRPANLPGPEPRAYQPPPQPQALPALALSTDAQP